MSKSMRRSRKSRRRPPPKARGLRRLSSIPRRKSSKRKSSRKSSKGSSRKSSKGSRSSRKRSTTLRLIKRLEALTGKKFSVPKARPTRAKKGKKPVYKYPSIPKNLPKSPEKKVRGDGCSMKVSEMRKKYKQGQKLLDEVDKYMGKN